MKFSALMLASVSANFASESFSHPRRVVVRDTSPENADRRYNQLLNLMTHYNPDFDERQHWGYGKFIPRKKIGHSCLHYV